MYVCVCNAVTERAIHRMVEEGCCTLGEVQARTGCADCCGTCHDYALEVLEQALERHPGALSTGAVKLPMVA